MSVTPVQKLLKLLSSCQSCWQTEVYKDSMFVFKMWWTQRSQHVYLMHNVNDDSWRENVCNDYVLTHSRALRIRSQPSHSHKFQCHSKPAKQLFPFTLFSHIDIPVSSHSCCLTLTTGCMICCSSLLPVTSMYGSPEKLELYCWLGTALLGMPKRNALNILQEWPLYKYTYTYLYPFYLAFGSLLWRISRHFILLLLDWFTAHLAC